jgi:tetratricopeptide (TPR) repeat protein
MGWPDLPGAEKDAREVASSLQELGFTVQLVLNPTSNQLKSTLNAMAFGMGRHRNRALLLYYAGHGETLELADGTALGHIIPTDCPLKNQDPRGFNDKAISMRDIEYVALKVKSKHFLMVFDSCFSGSLFNLVRAAPVDISEKSARPVRQFITAGEAGEQVPDKSVFKIVFLDGIRGYADLNKDDYVTGSELGMHLQHEVVNYTRGGQHPQYGKINNPKLDKGDFIFVPRPAKAAVSPASPAEDKRLLAYGPKDPGQGLGGPQTERLLLQQLKPHEADINAASTVLFDEKKTDQTIRSLEDYCARNQGDVKANLFLTKVYLEKCIFLKKKGNDRYKTLLYRPWNMAKRLHKQSVGSHLYKKDLYYIYGKTYFIKDKPKKAIKYANIALETSTSVSPYIDSMFLLGDSYAALAKKETSKYYSLAQKTYQEIIYLNVSDDHKALAYYKLGALFSRFGQNEKADQALDSALQLARHESVVKKVRDISGVEQTILDEEKQKLAYVPETAIREKVYLRQESETLWEHQVKDTVRRYNLYDSNSNPRGSFRNDFVDNGDGTVIDRATGLMWERGGSPSIRSFKRSKFYVRKLNEGNFAGYSDWRLPTVEELASLLRKDENNGIHTDPLFDTKQKTCWSSDNGPVFGGSTSNPPQVWHVDFREGLLGLTVVPIYPSAIPTHRYVRAVRSLR